MFLVRIFLVLTVCVLPLTQSSAADKAKEAEQRSSPRKILFDTDPGGDDILALLWLQSLAKQGHAEIVAVTTVGGNVGGKQTFANAGGILALGGFESVEVGHLCQTGVMYH